jgi:hypothetical protein
MSSIPFAFFLKMAHFEHLYISRRISAKWRTRLVEQVQNELLYLVKPLFN